MPSPNPTARREFKGAAKATSLSAQIVNGLDTTFSIADATGWPTGSVGKFVVTINADQTDAEKILCLSRTGTTVTVDTRGYDGTTAAGHANGATAVHTISAFDADEWNQHTNAATAVHGVAAVAGLTETQVLTNKTVNLASNTVAGTTAQFNAALSDNDFATLAGVETLTNKTLTSPTFNGATSDSASTLGGVSGTTLAAMPLGRIASSGQQGTTTGSIQTTETAYGAISNLPFTTVTGRRYKVTFTLYVLDSVDGDSVEVRLRDGAGTAPTSASTLLYEANHACSGGIAEPVSASFEWVPGAGNHNLGLFAVRNSGTGVITIGSTGPGRTSDLLIEDIGV